MMNEQNQQIALSSTFRITLSQQNESLFDHHLSQTFIFENSVSHLTHNTTSSSLHTRITQIE